MTRRTIAVLAVCAIWLGILAACEPTGDVRCDDYWGPQVHIERNGYRLDCTPPFEGRANDGRLVAGWTETSTRTVWMWPDRHRSPALFRRSLWHEAGHTYGYDEWHSDVFAWCHLTPHERDGLGWLAPMPTLADCTKVAP